MRVIQTPRREGPLPPTVVQTGQGRSVFPQTGREGSMKWSHPRSMWPNGVQLFLPKEMRVRLAQPQSGLDDPGRPMGRISA
jgi:hypothetical protein